MLLCCTGQMEYSRTWRMAVKPSPQNSLRRAGAHTAGHSPPPRTRRLHVLRPDLAEVREVAANGFDVEQAEVWLVPCDAVRGVGVEQDLRGAALDAVAVPALPGRGPGSGGGVPKWAPRDRERMNPSATAAGAQPWGNTAQTNGEGALKVGGDQ